jgi:hypothetical protein
MSDSEIQPGVKVRRKSDGAIGRIEDRWQAESISHHRFPVVVFNGVVHLPREFEVVKDKETAP